MVNSGNSKRKHKREGRRMAIGKENSDGEGRMVVVRRHEGTSMAGFRKLGGMDSSRGMRFTTRT